MFFLYINLSIFCSTIVVTTKKFQQHGEGEAGVVPYGVPSRSNEMRPSEAIVVVEIFLRKY